MKSSLSISEDSGELGGGKAGVKKAPDASQAQLLKRDSKGLPLELGWGPEPRSSGRILSVPGMSCPRAQPGAGW